MYLWKYWRETRVVFVVCMGVVLLGLARLPGSDLTIQTNQPQGGGIGPTMLMVMLVFQLFPISFIAWLLGSYGVGRDLGDRTGSYIFSRPRSRAFFVWSDWTLGISELLVIIVFLNLVLGLYLRRFLIASGDPGHGSLVEIYNRAISLPFAMFLNCAAALLLAGLVFSLTYLSTILLRHSRGLILAVGVLLGYLVLKQVVLHYWPGMYLPDLVAPSWIKTMADTGIRSGFWLSLALRAGVVVLFPLGAQWLLEKRDI